MSRYPPPDYRGPRERSRSPPRFSDRRASAASIFENRPPGPARTASDAPRGPRLDAPRPPPAGGAPANTGSRPGFSSLRDAPPLGSGDRARSYREREYDRRDRPPSPRDRSPLRPFKDSRDYSPRDLDIGRARRESRDGPLSAGSTYSDGQPPSSSAARGTPSRGRGRGDYSFRGGRGGRPNLDERDLLRRERSPPPRWTADPPRDAREPERRDDRRFERREDERRPSEWADRERDRDIDRGRRDQPPPKPEPRSTSEATSQPPQSTSINPARLAMIENTTAEASNRRLSVQQEAPPYLNGRAETTANRYASRGSSPPTQAPPVPAFTLSFAPPAATPAPSSQSAAPFTQQPKPPQEAKPPAVASASDLQQESVKLSEIRKPEPPPEAPTAPRLPPAAPKAHLVSPPPAAPRAPRAQAPEDPATGNNRLQGVRSLENLAAPISAPTGPGSARGDPTGSLRPVSYSVSPAAAHAMPNLVQPVSPRAMQSSKAGELNPPTGPRATRMSPAHTSVSPRVPLASPRLDAGRPSAIPRTQTPPPTAPSGPRNQSYSVSPKVTTSSVPTEPKANRAPPIAPRGPERGPMQVGRAPDRPAAPSWGAPTAPRGQQPLWNQWRRPGAPTPAYADKTIPAKRDILGEEKARVTDHGAAATSASKDVPPLMRSVERIDSRKADEMDIDKQPPRRQSSMMANHSAARSFFGKPAAGEDEDTGMSDTAQEPSSTSEDDESDMENNTALFKAKFERQKRQLEAQMVDLTSRHYRATTPLENLARLARISEKDLERFKEQRENEMDVDRSPVARKHHMIPSTRRSSDSGEGPDIITPKDEDDRRVAIRSSDDSSDGMRRIRRATPEPVNLPYLLKDAHMPFGDSETFKENLQRYEESKADLLDAMEEEAQDEAEAEEHIEDVFADEYRKWREECEILDMQREDRERLERQESYEPKPEIDAPSVVPINPILEGRRLHKFSSEYALEQVLKESEETARIEQERQDREARKNQADLEKEAKIPDQLADEEMAWAVFVDTNRYREPENLTIVFSYQPPPDDFTENEQHIFIAAFKETPKKWSEIASLLPGRTYKDCIRHYYANKWDGRFRDTRSKKLKAGGRRGNRGGARGPRGRVGGLMADLARVEDYLTPENMSEKGRPRRAAAPTTFAEKEAEAKASLTGPSPAKKPGPGGKADSNGDTASEKTGKRQKRTGDKPGRKPNKASTPLAALAAAPQGSPAKHFVHGSHSKEDLADAHLLTNLHGGHHGAPAADGHLVYQQDGYIQAIQQHPEESERPKAGGPPAKQGASSYWSVPEQNDFVKYIGHFGRDFAAIAAHMGTKTQTMIKNHYQRQVDGGNRPDLERAAIEADERRARGEDMGPPPTPTPIQKRKYENPPAPAQRALAPHAENADLDDSGPGQRVQAPKQGSPHSYQSQPRFTSSIANPAISAPRVGPSPLSTSATPATSLPATSHARSVQHPFAGSRMTFLPDTRSEARPSVQTVPNYRAAQDSPTHAQTSAQSRTATDAPDPQFIRDLEQEQERALRMQRQHSQQDMIDQFRRQPAMPRNASQGSPLSQPQHVPPDRKPILEDKPASPARTTYAAAGFSRPFFGSGNFPPISSTSLSPLSGRPGFNLPAKREDSSRQENYPPVTSAQPATASATPSEPKRSNVLSLLNLEPEETKPPKRENIPLVPPRAASPAQQPYPHTTAATPLSGVPTTKREPSFGQPSIPQSLFQHRGSFGQTSSASTPAAHGHKHEPSPGSGGPASQTAKPDWAGRVLSQSNQGSPPTPTLDRDSRSYPHHRPYLGALGQPRVNPSPPPLSGSAHSRTPSLSGPSGQQPREQSRASMAGQPGVQPLQPNPYASQSQSPFPNVPTSQAQNQAHHSHNSSLTGGPFPSFHQRSISRDDRLELERAQQQQQQQRDREREREREREEQDLRWRQQREAREAQRREELYHAQQRQQEQDRERERERQQSLHRAPPPPPSLAPPTFSGNTFSQGRNLDLRGQSWKDGEMAMREEQERQRQQQDSDRRRQEEMTRQREQDERRRQEELFFRRTPLGSGFGVPPPSAPRR